MCNLCFSRREYTAYIRSSEAVGPGRLGSLDREASGEVTDVGGQLLREGGEGIQSRGELALPNDTSS